MQLKGLGQNSSVQFSSVQSLSVVRLFATPWITARQASLSITISRSSLRLTSIESVMPSSHLILGPSPSPPAPNLSQHQSLFQSVSSSHQVAKVLELQLQHQSFQDIQGWFPLRLMGLISLLSRGFSRVFSSTPIWKHQFFCIQTSL